MGFIEELDKMDLADDVKERLIREHRGEVDPLKNENDSFQAQSRQASVEGEITALSAMGFSESPGLLKYVRRILLSPDVEEPGAVLLSDNEMGLSGDKATGATGREEISVAKAIRGFIEHMPKKDGKILLSQQAISDDDEGRPANGDDDEKVTEHKSNLKKITGRTTDRTRKRYHRASITAGEEV